MTLSLARLTELGRALFLGVLLIGGPALGQTVTARSGEHDGFTRIVLDFGSSVDWTVGRMLDGYALRLADGPAVYDLTGVFNRIGKTRLGAIWADPETGDLVFSANCPCHAIAFEFRPGTVVIDLKDGPPPAGSGFETALAGLNNAAEEADTAAAAPPQTDQSALSLPEFDWTRTILATADPESPPVTESTVETPPPEAKPVTEVTAPTPAELAAFEENLRAELAGAATSGIVELAEPTGTDPDPGAMPGGVLDQFRIGRKGQATLGQATDRQAELGREGAACAANDALDLASWGDPEKPVADQIADMRGGLVGEFDAVDPEKLKTAIRFHLYLGFGVEAQDLLAAFAPNDPETALWSAMAQVLEGERETAGYFAPMQGCQGPAALWALLASDSPPKAGFDRQPVLLAFSALPVHLRRHLGPRLVERFLTMGDDEGARILSEAIFRPGATDAPGIDLMKARISLEKGSLAETEAILRQRIAAAGPDQAEAYFTLVDLMAAQRRPMAPDEAMAVAALVEEQADGASADRTLALALAASGDFNAAFDRNPAGTGAASDIWGLLAVIGSDDDLLRHAVLADDALPGDVLPSEAIRIGERLLDLGLPEESFRWQKWAGNTADDPAAALLLARTQLALGMTAEALAQVAQAAKTDELARELAVQAFGAAGDDRGQADALDPSDPRLAPALGRAGEWQRLAQTAEGPWAALAQDIVGADTEGAGGDAAVAGPLARSAELVETSGKTRDRIQALLASTAKPES